MIDYLHFRKLLCAKVQLMRTATIYILKLSTICISGLRLRELPTPRPAFGHARQALHTVQLDASVYIVSALRNDR